MAEGCCEGLGIVMDWGGGGVVEPKPKVWIGFRLGTGNSLTCNNSLSTTDRQTPETSFLFRLSRQDGFGRDDLMPC